MSQPSSIAVYLCRCGSNISAKLHEDQVLEEVRCLEGIAYAEPVDLLCSEDGKAHLIEDLRKRKPGRVVFAACSPRDHERTMREVLVAADMNPYMMQMANVREHVVWVAPDEHAATRGTVAAIKAAVARVALHEPLEDTDMEVCPDVLVLGAGPAGLKAALHLAESGRKVILVEKSPAIGGMPVMFEEVAPGMECGPCMLEPLMDEVMHGEHARNIELHTMAEVAEVVGFFGNFIARIKRRARYIDVKKCIGCGECLAPCPVQARNNFNMGLDVTKAVTFAYPGALPSAPYISESHCIRFRGEQCTMCAESCPVEGAVNYQDREELIERKVGAVLVAVGGELYETTRIPKLGYGSVLGVMTSMEFERLVSSSGPTEGKIRILEGAAPKGVCIIHCAGSLDRDHKEYCSAVCCQAAFKYNHLIEKQLPGTKTYHLYKELVMPGKEEFSLYRKARDNSNAEFIRYGNIGDIEVTSGGEPNNARITYRDATGHEGSLLVDMVILCLAMVPPSDATRIASQLNLTLDPSGYFEELHGRLDAARSKVRGVYLAGTCRAPMDIQKALDEAMAASGFILSGLSAGRTLEVSAAVAEVDPERCSGCLLCIGLCPYKALSVEGETGTARVNPVLCQSCGSCVAACPAGAIKANHYTSAQVRAEVRGSLG